MQQSNPLRSLYTPLVKFAAVLNGNVFPTSQSDSWTDLSSVQGQVWCTLTSHDFQTLLPQVCSPRPDVASFKLVLDGLRVSFHFFE